MLLVNNQGANAPDTMPPFAMPANALAERALRKVGAFTTADKGPRPADMIEALYWLDMIMAEISGTGNCPFLMPATITQDLNINQPSYPLASFTGYPPQGIVYVQAAWVRQPVPNGDDRPCLILRRKEYEDIPDKLTVGTPESIYVDRIPRAATLFTYPTIALTGFTLRLTCQAYNPSVLAVRGNGIPTGNKQVGAAVEWNRMLVFKLAADIGDGPVRKLNKADIQDWRQVAAQARAALDSYSNREKPTSGRVKRFGRTHLHQSTWYGHRYGRDW